ncbi:hypothetical protein DL93DRAFT_2173219 [Clavulina sp. PMI_390]|nr:hypothetical protein DL93DRAFT_2173219 [Clavulina sp. PMI_390]
MSTATIQLVYYWLNIAGGFIVLPIITLTTLLSRRVKKQAVLINIYIILSYEALLACLLFVTRKYSKEENHVLVPRIRNGDPLCVVQAILFQGTTVLISTAATTIVLHVLILVRSIYHSTIGVPRMNTKYLIILPYLAYIAVTIPVLVAAVRNPSTASPHQMYCAVNESFASLLSSIATVAMALCSIILQVWILFILKREHTAVYSRQYTSILLYMAVTLPAIAGVGLGIATANDFTAMTPDVMVSCLPLITAIAFGTQTAALLQPEGAEGSIDVWQFLQQQRSCVPGATTSSLPVLPTQKRASQVLDADLPISVSESRSYHIERRSSPGLLEHSRGLDRDPLPRRPASLEELPIHGDEPQDAPPPITRHSSQPIVDMPTITMPAQPHYSISLSFHNDTNTPHPSSASTPTVYHAAREFP